MLGRLGFVGILGLVLALCGIAFIAVESLLIAGGLALVLVGIGLTIKALLSGMLAAFGMDELF